MTTRTRPAPGLGRTAWLTRAVTTDGILDVLALDDGYCGTLTPLQRIAATAWEMALPYGAWVAATGILWALDTGRVPDADYIAIKRLWARPLCELVAETAAACPHPTDVPHYLIARELGNR